MNGAFQFTKGQIIAAISVVAILIAGWYAYDLLTFRLKSSEPNVKSVATITPFIKVSFSQPIDSIKELSIATKDRTIEAERTIDGNTVTIKFDTTLVENSQYTLKFTDVHSKWFNNSIASTSLSFTPIYKEYSSLSAEQKKAAVSGSSSGQVNDKFLNNKFPLYADDYYIDVSRPEGTTDIYVEVIILSEVFNYDTNTQTYVSDEKAEQYYKQAMELIRSKGGDPSKYLITYSNPYLNSKYSKLNQD